MSHIVKNEYSLNGKSIKKELVSPAHLISFVMAMQHYFLMQVFLRKMLS